MKLSDLIRHTQKLMPNYTKYFSEELKVTSLTAEENICTVITENEHNFASGDLFTLQGAKVINEIVSLTQYRGIGTLVTRFSHQVTKNSPLRVGDSTHIEISGANEEEYNGKFLIMGIPNDNVIEFSIDDTAPYQATGNPIIKEDAYANFNGRQRVSEVIDANTFKFELPYNPATNIATGEMTINTGIRISGDFNVQNAIKAYEEQGQNELWGFLVLDGANVSKSRTNGTDAISTFAKGVSSSLSLIQDVSFFVFVPTADNYCWVDEVDLMQELRPAILKTLHNARFKSGVFDEDCYLSFIGDNPVDTDGTAYSIYQYKFQTTLNIYNEDGIEKEFAPKIKQFTIHEKNNLEDLEQTIQYISTGELPNESID